MEEMVFVQKSVTMSEKLFEIMETDAEGATEFDRQALAAFAFGMITTFAMEEKVEKDITFQTIECVLVEVFQYSKKQMKDFVDLLINSTKEGYHSGYYFMIHQGIEMYYEYIEGQYDGIFKRIMDTYLKFKVN